MFEVCEIKHVKLTLNLFVLRPCLTLPLALDNDSATTCLGNTPPTISFRSKNSSLVMFTFICKKKHYN